MIKLLYRLSFFLTCLLQAQDQPVYKSVFYHNQKLKKEWYLNSKNDTVLFWKGYLYKTDSIISYEKYYNDKGILTSEGWMLNGQKNGHWKNYRDHSLISEGTYQKNQPIKTWKFYQGNCLSKEILYNTSYTLEKRYYPNLQIQSIGNLNQKNKKVDYWKYYYNNGNLQSEGKYIDGNEEGFWKEYSNINVLIAQGSYKKGIKNGYWHFFSSGGLPTQEGEYIDGKKDKWWLFFDNLGSISHKCELRNNENNGYCIHYKRGKIYKVSLYKEGLKLKEWTDWESFKKDNGK